MIAHIIGWVVVAVFCVCAVYNAWRIWQSLASGVASFDVVDLLNSFFSSSTQEDLKSDFGQLDVARKDRPQAFWTIVVVRGAVCVVLLVVVSIAIRHA